MLVNFGKSIFTRRLPGILALCAWGTVHRHHALPAQGHVGTIQQGFATRRAYREAAAAEKGRWRLPQPPPPSLPCLTPQGPRRRVSPMDQKITNTILYLDNVSVSFDGSRR